MAGETYENQTLPRTMQFPHSFRTFLGFAVSVAGAATMAAAPATIFTGVRLIDGTGRPPVENATVIVENGRIVIAGRVDPATYAARTDKQVVPCDGMTIIPGLISNHSHLGVVKGADISPNHFTTENIEKALEQYEGYGVTAVLSLGVNKDLLYTVRDNQRADGAKGAQVFSADRGLGVQRAAPPIPLGTDQIARPATVEEARQAVRDMASRRADIIKIWVDDFFGAQIPKMPPEISRAIIDEAHRHNLRVAAHVFHLSDAKQLLKDGLDLIAHSVRDQPIDEEFISLLLQRRAGYIATLALDESQFIYAEQPSWMQSPAFRAAADPSLLTTWASPQYAQKMRANPLTPKNQAALTMAKRNVKALHDAGALIGFGTDSGATPTRLPGWAEHRELQLLVEAGLSPMDAIVCATRNAARVLREERDRGTLEPGKRADFLILSANPLDNIGNTTSLTAVYNGGRRIEPAFKGVSNGETR